MYCHIRYPTELHASNIICQIHIFVIYCINLMYICIEYFSIRTGAHGTAGGSNVCRLLERVLDASGTRALYAFNDVTLLLIPC